LRAIETLKTVDMIYAEDTRVAKKLLQHYDINTKCYSYHAHNENQKTPNLVKELQTGLNIALISDAGTPLISDPGFDLVRSARQLNLPVTPIPGPSALITALSGSGLPCEAFSFYGFLPPKHKAKLDTLQNLIQHPETLIFYESCHRIKDTLKTIQSILPNRHIVLAKELTKQFESFTPGTAQDILNWLGEDENRIKGEFVLLLSGYKTESIEDLSLEQNSISARELIQELVNQNIPVKTCAKITASLTNLNKNAAYELAQKLKL
jgi:16S rRNA (cytidine1402-2'-O)-methyltransferase